MFNKKLNFNIDFTESNIKLIKKICNSFNGSLCPVNSIIGGILSHEVLKACSGKYNPINQYGIILSVQTVFKMIIILNITDKKSRYSSQINIFGRGI